MSGHQLFLIELICGINFIKNIFLSWEKILTNGLCGECRERDIGRAGPWVQVLMKKCKNFGNNGDDDVMVWIV